VTVDPVALTAELLRQDTVNPPGREARCLDPLAERLAAAGFRVENVALTPERPNLIARIGPDDRPALAFTGHVDVVPLGEAPWTVDPFAGVIRDGRIYGRGASDMKSGVAAIVAAALAFARDPAPGVAVELALTSGEEVGLEGAKRLAQSGRLGPAGALVVAEPTGLVPCIGYRSVLWLDLVFQGRTAHASNPEVGDNALLKACRAAVALSSWDFDGARHPLLEPPSLNCARLHSGLNYNSVPDRAVLGVDLRLLPDQAFAEVEARVAELTGAHEVIRRHEVRAVWTDPDHPWLKEVARLLAERFGQDGALRTVPYCTDASALLDGYGDIPVLILGPGEAAQAHRTDEWCLVDNIRTASEIYLALMRGWRAS